MDATKLDHVSISYVCQYSNQYKLLQYIYPENNVLKNLCMYHSY